MARIRLSYNNRAGCPPQPVNGAHRKVGLVC